jgi:hypothetical protein
MKPWQVRPPRGPLSGLYCVCDGEAQLLGGDACVLCHKTIFVGTLVQVSWRVILTVWDVKFLAAMHIAAT